MPELLLPGLMMILGAALVPVLPHMLRQIWMLVLKYSIMRIIFFPIISTDG